MNANAATVPDDQERPGHNSVAVPELRPDVRLVARGDQLHVCTSTGTLRLSTRLPGTTASDDGAVRVADLPEPARRALRSRGLLYDSGEGHHLYGEAHPLYGAAPAPDAARPVAVAPEELGDQVRTLLAHAGVPTVHDGDGSAERAGLVVLPLSLPEDVLRRRVAAALECGTSLVVYLSTPTRLFFATLTPPHTPCPVCVTRRIRANHIWQAIADLPLDVLLGAAHSTAWPSTAVAVGLVAHEVRRLLGPGPGPDRARGAAVLTEFDHATSKTTGHQLFHLPGCPACADRALPPKGAEEEPTGVDALTSWERMRGAVDPLTGMVPQLRVDERESDLGGTTYARTAGATTTTWFSPVAAEARGGAAKSDPVTARVCAVGETLERYAAGVYSPDGLVRARLAALGEEAVDPRTLPLGSELEYAEHIRFASFDPDVEIDWVPGRSLTTGRTRYVPACAVYLPYRFPPGHRAWYDPISTGLAAGGSYGHAVHGGLMEVVERDSSVLFWENRLTLPSLDLESLPEGPARQIVERMRAQGVQVTAKDLTTDLEVPAVAVRFLEHTEQRPVTTHSARADLDPHTALLGALEEACLGWAGSRLWRETLDAGASIPSPEDVLTTLKDFSMYYWSADRLRHLEFWDSGPTHALPEPRPSAGFRDDVAEAVRRLAARDHEVIAVDITPIDVAECGVTVVRTLIPGLCPITLRSTFHRRGGPRVFHAPLAMGVRERPLAEEDLNPLPLPFL